MTESPSAADLEAHQKLHVIGTRISEIILGGQDGIVNVLGVVLGVAAASGDSRVIIAAALATTFAESLSMAAVAYTSTLADRDLYRGQAELKGPYQKILDNKTRRDKTNLPSQRFHGKTTRRDRRDNNLR